MTDRPQGVKVYFTGSGYGEQMNMSEGFTFDTLQKEFPGIYLGHTSLSSCVCVLGVSLPLHSSLLHAL